MQNYKNKFEIEEPEVDSDRNARGSKSQREKSETAALYLGSEAKGGFREKSNMLQAFINLFKSFIGIGILALPHTFHETGYVLASLTLLLIAMTTFYTTYLILALVKDNRQKIVSFSDVFEISLGKNAVVIYKLMLSFFQLGICVAYVLFFTEFFLIASGLERTPLNKFIFIASSLTVIIPLNLIRNFHHFHSFSLIANTLMVLTVLVISIQSIRNLTLREDTDSDPENLADYYKLPSFLGIAIFAFESIGNLLTVRNSMQKPEKFTGLFLSTAILVCVIYVAFATLCCLAFGGKLHHIILFGLEKEAKYFYFFQACYALALVISYPIQLYPVVSLIEEVTSYKNWVKRKENFFRKNLSRIGLTLLVFFLAFWIPKFSSFLNLIGSFSGIAIQFIFPLIAYQMAFTDKMSKFQFVFNMVCLILSFVGGWFAVIDSIRGLVSDSPLSQ